MVVPGLRSPINEGLEYRKSGHDNKTDWSGQWQSIHYLFFQSSPYKRLTFYNSASLLVWNIFQRHFYLLPTGEVQIQSHQGRYMFFRLKIDLTSAVFSMITAFIIYSKTVVLPLCR